MQKAKIMDNGEFNMECNEKSREPDYVGISQNDEKMIVQKSNPLLSLSENGISLCELKLLDMYLSKIDSHNPEKRKVRFEKGQIEKILGVDRIRIEVLNAKLDGLFTSVIIRDKNKPCGYIKLSLFETAFASPGEDGTWKIDLSCTPAAMEYIFNIDNIGYLRYRLKDVSSFSSRYSYVLYLYLLDNRYRKTWKVDLSSLKTILHCQTEIYNQFKFFSRDVLKMAQKEIHEKTELSFSYKAIYVGRRIGKIMFKIISAPKYLEKQEFASENIIDTTLSETEESDQQNDHKYTLCEFLGECACNNEFTPTQMRVITDYVIELVPGVQNDIERCNYLTRFVNKMNAYGETHKIDNRYAYLVGMLKKELEEE